MKRGGTGRSSDMRFSECFLMSNIDDDESILGEGLCMYCGGQLDVHGKAIWMCDGGRW